MKSSVSFIIVLSFWFMGCVSIFQPLDVTIVNEDKIPINKEVYLNKIQEIFLYECDRLDYNNGITIRTEFGEVPNNYRGMIKRDSLGYRVITNPDSLTNISDAESILSRQVGFALYFSWINNESGTDNYYWDAGVVTWLAGRYYLGKENFNNFSEALRSIISTGNFLDMEIYTSINKLKRVEWHTLNLQTASFVEFLVTYYGLDKVYELSREFIEINQECDEELSLMGRSRMKTVGRLFTIGWRDHTDKNNPFRKNAFLNKRAIGNNFMVEYLRREAYKKIFKSSYDELILKWLSAFENLPVHQSLQ